MSVRLRPCAAAASSVVFLATASPLGTPAAHSLRTLHGHALRRTDVAPGLEVSLRNILHDLLVQRQLRDQPFQLAVFFFQFFQPLRLVHLQPAVFLAPAVEGLHREGGFLASLWGGLSVGNLTSICRSIVTICSGLYLCMGMTRFSSKWTLSHSTWYKNGRAGQVAGCESGRVCKKGFPTL